MYSKVVAIALLGIFLLEGVIAAPRIGKQLRRVTPRIQGPIKGGLRGRPFGSFNGNITAIGYVEEEYFISGKATRFSVFNSLTPDGEWLVYPNGTFPYKTRILVRRPTKKKYFNGEVILEWMDVTNGYDVMISDHNGVYEAGYAYVGVSAQPIGLIGYATPGRGRNGLNQWDTVRYGTLHITDDSVSYDIFRQVAHALKAGKIRGVKAKSVIATGHAQAGTRLTAYANGIAPISKAVNAILTVVSAGQSSDFEAGFGKPSAESHLITFPTIIRHDLAIPVHQIDTESESLIKWAHNARQHDTGMYRHWEIAGASYYSGLVGKKIAELTARDQIPGSPMVPSTVSDVSWLPPLDAAYRHASAWIRGLGQPPRFPPFEIGYSETGPLNGSDLVRGEYGLVVGGVRQPELTVPVATYSGESEFGWTGPFDSALLRKLYPDHNEYVNLSTKAARQAQLDGVILGFHASELIDAAKKAQIPPLGSANSTVSSAGKSNHVAPACGNGAAPACDK